MTIDRGTGTGGLPGGCACPGEAFHDGVIQRLYATGLQLQSALGRISDPAAVARVRQSLHVLDEVIGDLRAGLRSDGP
jgi:signal transduction histidine kinase